jgi:hypothetical protein
MDLIYLPNSSYSLFFIDLQVSFLHISGFQLVMNLKISSQHHSLQNELESDMLSL